MSVGKKNCFVYGIVLFTHVIRAHISIDELHRITQLPHRVLTTVMQHLDYVEKDAEKSWQSYYHVFSNLIQEHNLRVGVEIGVCMGGHSESILRLTTVDKLYSIDPWLENPAFSIGSKKYAYEILFHRVSARLGKYGGRSKIIRAFSYNVVDQFEDESLDFVFIDGDHHYEAVKKDIEMWYPKVRRGGIIGGDDYATSWPGVPKAVDEFFEKKNHFVNQDAEQPRIWWVQK